MQKILSNSTIYNKELRERTDINPLLKTATQRYYFDGIDVFRDWFYNLLDDEERDEVRVYLQIHEL